MPLGRRRFVTVVHLEPLLNGGAGRVSSFLVTASEGGRPAALHSTHRPSGARLPSFDTPEENQAFAKKFDFNFPLLCDVDRKVGLAYGAADDASAANARRVGVVIGPDGKVKEWHAKVDARAFPQEALSRLQ
ncbi:MAG: redoxin domain-containing protein [Myxococcaceae bacterium]|nr:MAG: redoxin domain-containing protein [Myxococcaceae bacterium]